jgi:hypothetical protein
MHTGMQGHPSEQRLRATAPEGRKPLPAQLELDLADQEDA